MTRNNRLTLDERLLIEKYVKKNYSFYGIARIIQRTTSCVCREVNRYTRETYSAKIAQEDADQNFVAKNEKMKKKNREKPKYLQRIENLEMQMEILHDTIKELLKK